MVAGAPTLWSTGCKSLHVMMAGIRPLTAILTVISSLGAASASPWETVVEGDLTVKKRSVAGSAVREYLVETVMDAKVGDIEEALCDATRFPAFMPHVAETRILETASRTERVYTRVEPPVGGSRDYVAEVVVLERASEDGTGTFRQKWHALPDAVPERDGVKRIRVNEGSWHISSTAEGHSKVVYRFRVDPGGWVPEFVIDLANRKTIPETLRAVEQEAKRRARARTTAAMASTHGR